jgi:hypothetical protein
MYLFAGHYAYPLNLEWRRLGALALGGALFTVGVLQTSHIGIKATFFLLLLVWMGVILFRRRSVGRVVHVSPEGSGPGV